MNPETAEVVYRDESRVVYRDNSKLYEGTAVANEEGEGTKLTVREIDGYMIEHRPDGSISWRGAVINGEVHVNFWEMMS